MKGARAIRESNNTKQKAKQTMQNTKANPAGERTKMMATRKIKIQQYTPTFHSRGRRWSTVMDEYNESLQFATMDAAQAWIDDRDARVFETGPNIAGRPEYRIVRA